MSVASRRFCSTLTQHTTAQRTTAISPFHRLMRKAALGCCMLQVFCQHGRRSACRRPHSTQCNTFSPSLSLTDLTDDVLAVRVGGSRKGCNADGEGAELPRQVGDNSRSTSACAATQACLPSIAVQVTRHSSTTLSHPSRHVGTQLLLARAL